MGQDRTRWSPIGGAEPETALRHCQLHPPATDHVCCGRMGQAALLRTAGTALGNEAWNRAAAKREAEVLGDPKDTRPREYRFFSTSDSHLALPGLFTGLAGVGLEWLPEGEAALRSLLTAGLVSA